MNTIQNALLNLSDNLWCLSVVLRDTTLSKVSDKILVALNKIIYDNVKLSMMYKDAKLYDNITPEVELYCESFYDEFGDIAYHLSELEDNEDPEIYHERTSILYARMNRVIPKLQALVNKELEN